MKLTESVYYWFNTAAYYFKSPDKIKRLGLFIRHGSSEVFLRDIYRSLGKYDLCIDVGAYNGDSTVYLNEFVTSSSISKVVAFEPTDKIKDIPFYIYTELHQDVVYDGSEVSFTENDLMGCVSEGKDKFKSVKLSEYIDQDCFLKMDCEGSEYVILSELARSKKLKYVKEFVIEFHVEDDGKQFGGYMAALEKDYKLHYRTDACPLARDGLRQDILVHGIRRPVGNGSVNKNKSC